MGSCENLTTFVEPLCKPVIEERSCDECTENLLSKQGTCSRICLDVVGANVNPINALGECSRLSNDDSTCCVSSNDVTERGVLDIDGRDHKGETMVDLGFEKVLDDECRVNGLSLIENQSEVGVGNLAGRGLDSSCLSSASGSENGVSSRDGLVSECENVAASLLQKSVDDECGICVNDCQSQVDIHSGETDSLILESSRFEGHNRSVKSSDMPLDEMSKKSSPRILDQGDEHRDVEIADDPFENGVTEAVDDKGDVLDEVKVITGSQTCTFEVSELLMESVPVTCSPINCGKGDKSAGGTFVKERGNTEEKSGGSAGMEKDMCSQTLPDGIQMPLDMTPVIGSQSICVEKDDKNGDTHSVQGSVQMGENRNVFVGMENNESDRILSSSCSEVPSELKPLAGQLTDYVTDDQNKGNIERASSGGVMEVREEKFDTCNDILHLSGDTMATKSEPCNFSPRSGVHQDEYKDHQCNSGPCSEEVSMEQSCAVAGIDYDQILSSKHSQIVSDMSQMTGGIGRLIDICQPELSPPQTVLPVAASGFSSSEGKNMEICEPAKQEKANASADIGINMGNQILSSCNNGLMTSFDGKNSQTDHKSFSHLSGEILQNHIEESKTDNCIVTMPVQSFTRSLESLEMSDSPSNATLKDEQRNDESVEVLSAEKATELVEEKRDGAADLNFKTSTSLSPIEEKSNNRTFDCLDTADILRKDASGAISSSNAADVSGQKAHKEDKAVVGSFTKAKHQDNVSSSSRRSSRTGISRQTTRARTAAGNSRSKTKVQYPHGVDDIISKIARKKRSCASKQARSSIWGLLDNVTQCVSQSDASKSNQTLDQGSHKVKGGQRSRKRNKTQTSRSSVNTSTSCLRFKVKVGKEIRPIVNVIVPEVVDTTKSDYANSGGKRSGSGQGNVEFPNPALSFEVKLGEEGTERKIHHIDMNPEDMTANSENSALDSHDTNKKYESIVIPEAAGDATIDDYSNIHSHKGFENLRRIIENSYVDPGTSPDSEVINAVPDIEVGDRSHDASQNSDLTNPEAFTTPVCITGCDRGKKCGSIAKPSKKRGGKQVKDNGSHSSDTLTAPPGANASNNSSSSSVEPLVPSKETEIFGEEVVPSTKPDGSLLPRGSKSSKTRKDKSIAGRSRKKSTSAQGENRRKSGNKRNVKEKGVSITNRNEEGVCDSVEQKKECPLEIGSQIVDNSGKCDAKENIVSSGMANMSTISGDVPQQCLPPESAWVLCDDCCKWRRIPVALANSIDENCTWVCKENVDKAFADCSVPQEKSNADINAELGISDCEEESSDSMLKYNGFGKGFDRSVAALPESSFRRIDSNVFLHRGRKTQTIDEIMVCHCKAPQDGRFGCGDECLNRMLNIECVEGTCPCGNLCSNQQFQKRKYANMQWFPCGKKGFGLQLLEDVSKGQFIIEYVGEVLDMQSYEARQREYAANGHKHFYFMTLDGSEVIDACAKGNLGRFINHSCDPNCRTEKWMVNGEICIGLFALRDMRQGEELTFDYNYVRVFGAAAKKCHCGSPQCRGYIGGDPQNTEVIYQGDSDDEYPEPVMIEEVGNADRKIISKTSSRARRQILESAVKERNKQSGPTKAVMQPEITSEVEDLVDPSASAITQSHSSQETGDSKEKHIAFQPREISVQAEDVSSTAVSVVQQENSSEDEPVIKSSLTQEAETASPANVSSKLVVDDSVANKKSDTVGDKQGLPKSRPRIKTSCSSGSVKKVKANSSGPTGNKVKMPDNKVQPPSIKPKKAVEGPSNGRFEAVQEKLNELLDTDGGISKRKDAARGYLKLLLLTVASGTGGNKEAIQSNRDLSMILDALLKTRSRMVLTDIINKNGLQMLHNILKKYRSDFKKIPILRKLLKVLEYLAVREILTIQHISGGPPCAGMESLRESMLSLTEHDDKQVHQIARNFRDRWIPKHLRKAGYMDNRDDCRMDFHRGASNRLTATSQNHRREQSLRPTEAIDCVIQSSVASTSVDNTASEAGPSPHTGCGSQSSSPPRVRKRKTRWDQPTKIKYKEQKIESSSPEKGTFSSETGKIAEEDAPPGFSSPCNPPVVSSDAISMDTNLSQRDTPRFKFAVNVSIGHPQKRFISRLPVSYGIPLAVSEQFGSPKAGDVDGWVIAPGMPFCPFPPLPPLPRDKTNTSASEACELGGNIRSTTEANESSVEILSGEIQQQTSKRLKVGPSNDLGKRFFRQQKWNKGPPWLWRRNELRNSYGSPDFTCRVDDPGCNNLYQHPQQQNHH